MVTRFKDTAPTRSTNAATNKLKLEKLSNRIDQLEQNINAFIAQVQDVTFSVDAADAKPWMDNWEAQLLSGRID